jgi:beta-lactamase class A
MKTTITALCLALLSGTAGAAESEKLNAFLKDLSGKMDLSKVTISVIDLRGAEPQRGGWHDTDIRPVASVIKLNLLAAAYNAMAGGVSPDTPIVISKNNWTGTWDPNEDGITDPNPPIKLGETWTLARLAEVMVRRSDNVATNTLIDFLDRKKVTAFVQGLGLTNTFVRHKLSSGSDVSDPDATGYNQMPARDAATLLGLIARKELISPSASEAMYGVLSGQLDRELIAAALPAEASYAGKTGELSAARNDAAIVRAPGREYVLVVFTQMPGGQAKPVIRQIAAAVDGYFKNDQR